MFIYLVLQADFVPYWFGYMPLLIEVLCNEVLISGPIKELICVRLRLVTKFTFGN